MRGRSTHRQVREGKQSAMADDDVSPGGGGGAGIYSHLLFGEDDVVVSLGADSDGRLNFSPPPSSGCRRDSPASNLDLPPNRKKRHVKSEGKGSSARQNRGKAMNDPPGNNSKKNATAPPAKVKRRQKLGDRIAALQQLVSPFGKGDTVSVLTEANCYIRSLQDQVQVLCSPYLTPPPCITEEEEDCGGGENRGGRMLRGRGLCLVPIDAALPVVSHYDFSGDVILSRAAVPRTARRRGAELD
ncbi:unnamed protein product [Cuscuta campestris]|uniref:BHLH domain-containing protein n=1 Tax=Cuscuta campestris TaxID=132261 RepID=A0A484LPC2_9ASTE|nr:unnamed protein product [Cuscuta campestris]